MYEEQLMSVKSDERKLDCRMFYKYEWYNYAGCLHKTADTKLNNHKGR